MKIVVVFCLISVSFLFYSQSSCSRNKESRWKKDTDLVLEKIVPSDQKIRLYQKHPFIDIKDVLIEFDSLKTYLRIDSTALTQIWKTHKLNFTYPIDWLDRNPKRTKEKMIHSKNWQAGKMAVLSASATIYVETNIFFMELTKYCGGLCFFRTIYLAEKINDGKDIIIRYKIASGAG